MGENKNLVGGVYWEGNFSGWGRNEQTFSWLRGGTPLTAHPSRENPAKENLMILIFVFP